MSLGLYFYRAPRLVILTLAVIAVSGAASFVLLPRTEDPRLTSRVARVTTAIPGATPARVEALVTEPLEEELRDLPELKSLYSESRDGFSSILIELEDEVTEVEEVWSRVRDRLADAEPQLAAEASTPHFDLVRIEAFTLIFALRWDGPPEDAERGLLHRYARVLEDRLREVPGTEDVERFGDPADEVRVLIDPAALAGRGLTAEDVARALRASDAKVPGGVVRQAGRELLVEVDDGLDAVAEVAHVPLVVSATGDVVRLGDVGRVELRPPDPLPALALIDGRPGVSVAARMGADRRVDAWSPAAEAVAEAFASELPRDVSLQTVFRQVRYTEARLHSLVANLLIGIGLVVLVVLVLMGWRAALLVGASLPLASLMTLSGLRFLEVPIHQMSVTGLIIALGLLIDNAIVMADEMSDRLRSDAPEAAIAGSARHLTVPLLSSTVTTTLAFLPIVLLAGPAGEFVGSIGISVILALWSSLFLALAVLPAAAGFLHRGAGAARPGRRWWQAGVQLPRWRAGYEAALGWVLRRPRAGIALALVLPLLGFVAFGDLREQFFPPSDRDQFRIDLRLPEGSSIEATRAAAEVASAELRALPGVRGVQWFCGEAAPKYYYNMLGGQQGAPFFAQALVQLEREEGSFALIDAAQQRLDAALPHVQAICRQLEQGPPFEAPVELTLFGPDPARLAELGEAARQALVRVPDVVHTRATLGDVRPQVQVALDRELARASGVEPRALSGRIQRALRGAPGGSVLLGGEELPVVVHVADGERATLARLAALDLGSASPSLTPGVPLSAVGALRLAPQATTIARKDGSRANVVRGYLRAGVLPADALTQFRAELERDGFSLPRGYRKEWGGEAEQRDQAVGNLLGSAALLFVLMGASLVLAFNSFRQAALIAAVGGLAVGLSLLALWLWGHAFGFTAIVGTMGLVGVAINDAIVVLAGIREHPRAAAGDLRAIQQVVVRSTRHVLATTLTTVAGFVPLLVAGSAFWSPLAVSIAGGVAGATLLALSFVPAAYLVLLGWGMRCPPPDVEVEPGRSTSGRLLRA
ncbi:MAG: efflux RND transporter permease subunit [Planctomycetes bacterium]|nr:efflux RND transporter permease subunit [Planctomycetota bacterium]